MDCTIEFFDSYSDLEDKYRCDKAMFSVENVKDNCGCYEYSIYIVIGKKSGIMIQSVNYQTRATDLMNFLSDKISLFSAFEKVDEQTGEDNVESYCLYEGNSYDDYIDQTTLVNQIKQVIVEYDTSTEIIDARTFYEEQKDNILTWSQFRKVNLPRCFVSVKFLKKRLNLDESTCIVIKTLENNSGITIKASDDKVIMIGVNGECYDMPGEKFDELYQIVDPDVKIIELSKNASTYEMQPKAFIQGKSEVDLLDFASVCKSRKTNTIYACKKSKNVKVFSTRISGTNQYYYGNGEKKPFYLTVDKDSPTSVHVVDREVFEKSYELVKL